MVSGRDSLAKVKQNEVRGGGIALIATDVVEVAADHLGVSGKFECHRWCAESLSVTPASVGSG